MLLLVNIIVSRWVMLVDHVLLGRAFVGVFDSRLVLEDLGCALADVQGLERRPVLLLVLLHFVEVVK